jgi:hypothetical protein
MAQMREIARRFTMVDHWGLKDPTDWQLRLLTTPLYRYESPEHQVVDGRCDRLAGQRGGLAGLPQRRELVDVEEPTIVDIVRRDAPVGHPVRLTLEQVVTATATQLLSGPGSVPLNTSEFSAGRAVVSEFLPTCDIATLNPTGADGTAAVQPDLDNPGDNVLIVTGTSKNDVIIIEPRPSNLMQVRSKNTGKVLGIFANGAFEHVIVFAQGGNDTVA